jgi:hypothetical protein
MHRVLERVLCAMLAAWAASCGRSEGDAVSSSAPVGGPTTAAASSGPAQTWVENPEYRHWSQFPLNTTVVRVKQVTSDRGQVKVTTTLRLVEKNDEQVTVESQVRVVRDHEPLTPNPPQPLVYPARFPLPAGMSAAAFDLPALRARRAGQETLNVNGQEFQTDVFTWEEVNETGPMRVTYWRHAAVPGRMVRQEIHGPNHDSVEQVTQFSIPATSTASP